MSVTVLHADMRAALADLPPASIAACVTDPPYHLTATKNAKRGFLGREWDGGGIAFEPATWEAVLRVMKPGGYLVAFSGARTYHRMACAIEDAGFAIRDQLQWLYGSGFPKAANLGAAIDKHLGAARTEIIGSKLGRPGMAKDGSNQRRHNGAFDGSDTPKLDANIYAPATPQAAQWEGWSTQLKPAHEPIVLAQAPLSESFVVRNVLAHGAGALNVAACRVGDEILAGQKAGQGRIGFERTDMVTPDRQGRWPANVMHDESVAVRDRFEAYTLPGADNPARFFFSAKADEADRLGSKHPTVKPTALMAWLIRLVTPPGGTVLDPFAGSGATGMAAMREGFPAILIEREAEHVADIRRRVAHVSGSDTPLFSDPTPDNQASLFEGV